MSLVPKWFLNLIYAKNLNGDLDFINPIFLQVPFQADVQQAVI